MLASVVFGWLAAPFAIYKSSKALRKFRSAAATDAATYRQLALMRWLAIGLLILWLAFFIVRVLLVLAENR